MPVLPFIRCFVREEKGVYGDLTEHKKSLPPV